MSGRPPPKGIMQLHKRGDINRVIEIMKVTAWEFEIYSNIIRIRMLL
jgi:hypothetical protein